MGDGDGEQNKIQNYVVIPELNASFEKTEPNVAIKQLVDFIKQKTQESQKCVEATSAVSFMANSLQNRQQCTEFSVQMVKFFNDMDVTCDATCSEKLEQLAKEDEEIATLVNDLKNAWKEWESFLEKIDKSVEQLAGPYSPKSISSADNIKLANAKSKGGSDQGTLLAYVQSSTYQMIFIEVVFSLNNCGEHVMRIYERLKEFQDLNCDILILAKSGDGGGFLKLVGVPFRLLLDEEQSLARILQHRQSAVTLCGKNAITMLAELGSEPEFVKSGLDKNGGALLMDHGGNILYNHSCKEPSDWPNVEDILKEVKKNKKESPEQEKTANGTSKSKDTNVEVGKRRCCTIM